MLTPLRFAACSTLVCVSLITPRSAGQAISTALVQSWFDREWKESQIFPIFKNCHIAWHRELVYAPPDSEFQQLRDAVKGHPDHPAKHELEAYERHRSGTPTVQPCVLWIQGEGNWRYDTDLVDFGMYLDTVVTPRHAWRMSNVQLTIVDPRYGYPSSDDYSAQEAVFWPELGLMMYGGMTAGRGGVLQPQLLALDESVWRVRATELSSTSGKPVLSLEYSGHWDSNAGRGFVDAVKMELNAAHPASVGTRHLFKDWQYEPTIDRWVARRVEEYRPNGREERRLIFDGVSSDEPRRFAEVIRIPETDHPDPVRGKTTFRSIQDYRDTSGPAVSASNGVVVHSVAGSAREDTWRRWGGWAAAGSLIVALLAIRLRRSAAP